MNHPGYFKDYMVREYVYRCAQCQFDTFSEDNIKGHVKATHPPINLPESDSDAAEWLESHRKLAIFAKNRLVIGFLTWNTVNASTLAAKAIAAEVEILRILGIDARVCWVDNGSTDGTVESVEAEFDAVPLTPHKLPTNMGQSHARNLILDCVDNANADYLMFIDGDVEPIKFSSYAMLRYLHEFPSVGVVGMYTYNCTATENDPTVAKECRYIPFSFVDDLPRIAWTQYGMFNARLFQGKKRLRFDTAECFQGPGWGFEDDDLGIAIWERGYGIRNTKMFRFMHRHRNSSLRLLDPALAAKVYAQRRDHVYNKWVNVVKTPEAKHYLERLRNQTMPILTAVPEPVNM